MSSRDGLYKIEQFSGRGCGSRTRGRKKCHTSKSEGYGNFRFSLMEQSNGKDENPEGRRQRPAGQKGKLGASNKLQRAEADFKRLGNDRGFYPGVSRGHYSAALPENSVIVPTPEGHFPHSLSARIPLTLRTYNPPTAGFK